MSLKEQLENLGVAPVEEELEESVVDETKADQDSVEEDTPEEEVEKDTKESDEEPKKEEKEEHQPTPKEWAEFRRLSKQLEDERRVRQELEAKLNAPKEPVKAETVVEDLEPNKDENLEEWLAWRDRQIEKKAASAEAKADEVLAWRKEQEKVTEQQRVYQGAIQEFTAYEAEAKSKFSDYEDVSKFYTEKISDSIRSLYPSATDAQIQQAVVQQILNTASQYARQGLQPVEAMYFDAKNRLGYKPSVAENEPEKKASVKDIAAAKKKSLSSISAGGKNGSVPITKETIKNMSVGEWARLSPERLREIERLRS